MTNIAGFKLTYFSDKAAFVDDSARYLHDHLSDIVKNTNKASLFLSGGTTPGPIYQKLAQTDLPWETIDIAQVDERWVDESDPGSNSALIRKHMLQHHAQAAAFTSMKISKDTAISAQPVLNKLYAPLFQSPSIAVLGMGNDGHIAGWFPQSDGIKKAVDVNATDLIQPIMAKPSDVTGPYLERITLTLPALLKSQAILLLIKGADKEMVLKKALDTRDLNRPISHLLNAIEPGRLTVFILEG